MTNYLSIDFESWVYPEINEFISLSGNQRKKLDKGYVRESAEQILELLAKYKTKLSFFTLGQLYEWYPETFEMIAAEGHEICYHTHKHEVLYSEEILIKTLKKSEKFLKRFRPKGFRAPRVFLKKEYFKILSSYGFIYDSSMTYPYKLREKIDGIVEIPISSLFHLPIGSGYSIGIFGKRIKFFYDMINKQGQPVISYIHNWQIIKPKKASFPNTSYLLSHPHYFAYSLEIKKAFEFLLQNFKFAPLHTLVED